MTSGSKVAISLICYFASTCHRRMTLNWYIVSYLYGVCCCVTSNAKITNSLIYPSTSKRASCLDLFLMNNIYYLGFNGNLYYEEYCLHRICFHLFAKIINYIVIMLTQSFVFVLQHRLKFALHAYNTNTSMKLL